MLGFYRSLAMLPAEELKVRHNPPDSYPLTTAHWRQSIDAYAAELAPAPQRTWGKKLLRDIFDKALQVFIASASLSVCSPCTCMPSAFATT